MSADVSGIFEQITVELKDDAIREWNMGVILMDGIQHVAIAGDLAFGTVGGFRTGGDEFPKALVIFRNDAFEAIREPTPSQTPTH
jgi:hypothetical protein